MWGDHGADLRGAMITRIGSTELITPEMIGWDLRGSIITRIGSTELITPEMRGVGRPWCGSKGSYNHTHRIHRTDDPMRGVDLRGALIMCMGSTELITPDMRGCGEIMVRI